MIWDSWEGIVLGIMVNYREINLDCVLCIKKGMWCGCVGGVTCVVGGVGVCG